VSGPLASGRAGFAGPADDVVGVEVTIDGMLVIADRLNLVDFPISLGIRPNIPQPELRDIVWEQVARDLTAQGILDVFGAPHPEVAAMTDTLARPDRTLEGRWWRRDVGEKMVRFVVCRKLFHSAGPADGEASSETEGAAPAATPPMPIHASAPRATEVTPPSMPIAPTQTQTSGVPAPREAEITQQMRPAQHSGPQRAQNGMLRTPPPAQPAGARHEQQRPAPAPQPRAAAPAPSQHFAEAPEPVWSQSQPIPAQPAPTSAATMGNHRAIDALSHVGVRTAVKMPSQRGWRHWLYLCTRINLGLSPDEVPNQFDVGAYDRMRAIFTERFASRTRDEWTAVFAGTDACVTPVLTWTEAAHNEHLLARSTVIRPHGVEQAAPAPRFSRTPAGPVGSPPKEATSISDIDW